MKKILIAEDDEKIHLLISTILEKSGRKFEIHKTKNGKQAIEMAAEIIPDLAILDVMMPGATGYEVCEKIKADPETSRAKVLFVTAFGSSNTRKLASAHGGDALLVKPFSAEDLLANVDRLLGK